MGASRIDAVFVSTDDDRIADAAHAEGAGVIRRPVELAGDTASSESALLHALDEIAVGAGTLPGVTVFLQATSPFVDSADLDEAVRRVVDGEDDVVFSVVPSHAFLWRDSPEGAEGVNHEASVRPRRQEREPEYRETGAFYVMRTDGFRAAGHRFFGRIGMLRVPDAHAIEIDDPADLALARVIARGGLGDDDPVGTGPVVVPPQSARHSGPAAHDGRTAVTARVAARSASSTSTPSSPTSTACTPTTPRGSTPRAASSCASAAATATAWPGCARRASPC